MHSSDYQDIPRGALVTSVGDGGVYDLHTDVSDRPPAASAPPPPAAPPGVLDAYDLPPDPDEGGDSEDEGPVITGDRMASQVTNVPSELALNLERLWDVTSYFCCWSGPHPCPTSLRLPHCQMMRLAACPS
jgi:hypothetical protein